MGFASNSSAPSVSIVIPCYNGKDFIEHAITSALRQTYPHVEVIVIDDGSRDGTVEILRRRGTSIRWEKTGSNRGACAARNRGLALASGDYVKFLDADDILALGCLESQISAIQSLGLTERQIIFGDHVPVDETGAALPRPYRYSKIEDCEAPFEWLLECGPMTSSPLYPRKALLEVGGFDVTVKRGQEHELNLRLGLAGYSFVHRKLDCYLRREHSGVRISSAGHERIIFSIDYLRGLIVALDRKYDGAIPDDIKKTLAGTIWHIGRTKAQSWQAAGPYWRLAREIAPNGRLSLSRKQRLACALLGPTLTARLLPWWAKLRAIVRAPRSAPPAEQPQ